MSALFHGRIGHPKVFSDDQKKFLLQFLEPPDISYTLQGRKDQVYMSKNAKGDKQYQAKHYLLSQIRDLVDILNRNSHTDELASYKSSFEAEVNFSSLLDSSKSRNTFYQQDIPEVSCLCDKCENIELLATGIRKAVPSLLELLPTTDRAIVQAFVCSTEDNNCAHCLCSKCPSIYISALQNVDEIEFYQGLCIQRRH